MVVFNRDNCQDGRLGNAGLVTDKLGGRKSGQVTAVGNQFKRGGFTTGRSLPGHFQFKTGFIKKKVLFGRDFFDCVQRKTMSVVKLESDFAGQGLILKFRFESLEEGSTF